jgi:hypothetical protein
MKIKAIVHKGVRHVVIKDPSSSGVIALPIESGNSPFAQPGNTWSWDGNLEAPTLTPSVQCTRDHFNVTAGNIVFHGDAKHANAGKTVPMPDLGDLADFWKDTPTHA